MYTIQEFAKITGKNLRAAQRAADRLGLQKWGGRFIVQDADFERLLAIMHKAPGRPRGSKNR